MKISIVVPCYNSEGSIAELVRLCAKEFDQVNGYTLEMVLVNDASRDGTFEQIKMLAQQYPFVKGIDLAKNFGQHNALLCGFHHVTGDLVVGIDDDLQSHPVQIHQLIEKLDEGYDVVFGKYKKRHFSPLKNFFGKISQALLFKLTDRPKGVEMSSFWVAKRFVIEEMKQYRGVDAFTQLLFARTTQHLSNVEVEHYDREIGTSNYSFKKSLRLFLSFMSFSTIPLRAATFLGILFSLVGFAASLVVLIRKLVNPEIAIGWSSLMCLMLIVAGITFLMLGIIGDYVGKLVLTQNETPQFVVREYLNCKKEKETE